MSHTPKIPGINVFDSLTMGGDVKMVGLPTADPQVEDKLWNDNGGIKVSAGTGAFNISTRDTEENIITTSPTNPEGEYTIAYGTDTQDLYVWNGSVWYKFTDINGGVFIEVYDTEAEVLALTSEPDYTIVHAKDTDKLYVWDGSNWYIYNNNSTAT